MLWGKVVVPLTVSERKGGDLVMLKRMQRRFCCNSKGLEIKKRRPRLFY